jgi:XTP/dITP diphosphohydrolase
MRTQLLLATRNKGKTVEIRRLLNDLNVDILSLIDFPEVPETEEDGETLEANAFKKAHEAFRHTGLPGLADDTGLEVFELDMAPGVRSARFAGERVTYAQNNQRLLEALAGVPEARRNARFRCVAAYVDQYQTRSFEGICSGRIILEPRGSGGFGYDPLFVPDGYEETFSQLDLEVKNRISHRARAFLQMKQFLLEHLQKTE